VRTFFPKARLKIRGSSLFFCRFFRSKLFLHYLILSSTPQQQLPAVESYSYVKTYHKFPGTCGSSLFFFIAGLNTRAPNPLERNRLLNGPPGASKRVLRMSGIRIPKCYPDDDRKIVRDFQSLPKLVGMGSKGHGRG